ncbi:MAG: AhpC/TSA family protein, partial [Acidobacteria bacterium]|nr:AhpC/TSA family protein [Acidobacteriota bacterium]
MREKKELIEKRGVRLACVVQGTPQEAARFCRRHGMETHCIPDPTKQSYRAKGFPRIGWKEILFPSDDLRRRRQEAKAAGCSVSLRGTFQKHSDVLQLPGAALIAPGGRILWL